MLTRMPRMRRLLTILASTLIASCVPGEHDGAVLHRGLNTDPTSLDPHKYSGNDAAAVLVDVREGLLAYDSDGTLVPGAAERWTVSEDGRSYTFFLRQDAHWSNGEPVDAYDFLYSLRRLVDPAEASPNSHNSLGIRNAAQILRGELPPSELGVSAREPYVLDIELEAPRSYFLQLLAHPSLAPLYFEHGGSGNVAPTAEPNVFNGPFALESRMLGSSISLSKNKHFHSEGSVRLDGVIYHVVDQEIEHLRFAAGELHISDNVSEIAFSRLRQEIGPELQVGPPTGLYFYGLNQTDGSPLSNLNLRRALYLAIDRDVISQKLLGRGEVPAFSIVPPSIHGFENRSLDIANLSQSDRNDMAAEFAALAVEEIGAKTIEIEIHYNTGGGHAKIAAAIGDMWRRKLGVEVSLRGEEFRVFLSSIRQRSGIEVFRLGWTADYDDPYAYLQMFQSSNSANYYGYKSSEFDLLLGEAIAEVDPRRASELYARAEELLLAELPVLPIYFQVSKHLVSRDVSGWLNNGLDVHPSRFLSLDGQQPE